MEHVDNATQDCVLGMMPLQIQRERQRLQQSRAPPTVPVAGHAYANRRKQLALRGKEALAAIRAMPHVVATGVTSPMDVDVGAATNVEPPPAKRVRFSADPPQEERVGYDASYDKAKTMPPEDVTTPTEEERRALHVDVVANTPLFNWGATPDINREMYIERTNIRDQLMAELRSRSSSRA